MLAGRLEDKSAIVRKQALLALASMLTFNPFAPQLPEDKFKATLDEYERKLKVQHVCSFLVVGEGETFRVLPAHKLARGQEFFM